jgi:hypothetical protein
MQVHTTLPSLPLEGVLESRAVGSQMLITVQAAGESTESSIHCKSARATLASGQLKDPPREGYIAAAF